MAANEKLIKKFEKKADKELEKRTKLQDKYAKALLDTSKGIISQRESIHEIDPLSKAVEKQKKRVKNAEINLQRVLRKGKSKKSLIR
jgi:hypothetical protein